MIRRVLRYVLDSILCVLRGRPAYYAWMAGLLLVMTFGGFHYLDHLTEGLKVTNMTDEVSWGIGIANFVYFVGIAAAAVVLVFPAYVMGRKDLKEVVLLGELLAVVAVVMCLLFIFTDIGRPDRFWHLFPGPGILNLPSSLLSWDVVVFNGYLLMSFYIPSYLLYREYTGNKPKPILYVPLIFLSIAWALSIHTVTAFLLAGLGSRSHWGSAILAPRFLISAGASGPAALAVIFTVINRFTRMDIKESVFLYLRSVLRVTMPINLFLLGCELFQEFYTGSLHSVSAYYLYFGLHGQGKLVPWIWTAITLNTLSTIAYVVKPIVADHRRFMVVCVMTIVGIWIEKGMGLIFPGFIPDPLGQVVEYSPTFGEITVSFAVLALGLFLFTVMAKIAIAIRVGDMRYSRHTSSPRATAGPKSDPPRLAEPNAGPEPTAS